MEEYRFLKGLQVKIDRNQVLKQMDCYEDSPVYEEVLEEYESHIEELSALAEPCGILGITHLPEGIAAKGEAPGAAVIYSVTSVGNKLKDRSTKAFEEGDYVMGIMIDAIADAALFSLESDMIRQLREFCREHHVGIRRRIEAPQDIPMKVQRAAHEFLKLKDRLNIDITAGYMFDPVKTACQVFILSENEHEFKALHDCRQCTNYSCRLRHIPPCSVTAEQGGEERIFLMMERESLMDTLIREGYHFSAVCGGKGRCGKCGVQVLEGNVPATDADRQFYTKEQLKAGWRLSCMAFPKEDIRIRLDLRDESDFEVLGTEERTDEADAEDETFDIAVDIGTTTIAMALVGRESGKIRGTTARVNSQRMFGADVITRIKASTDGKKEELRQFIRRDLSEGIRTLLLEAGLSMDRIGKIAVSGNTTMGHLLMGFDCSTLGVYPFTPVNIDLIRGNAKDLIFDGTGSPLCAEETAETETVLLPGISAYVGGDIVSGLYECGFSRTEEINMLIDLGTNGEMALGNKDRILVTSTAAGPAFEGGNISCGCGSIAGAICSAEIDGTEVKYRTIKDGAPAGICGTGVLEIMAELLKEEWVDGTGAMDEDYFDDGFPIAETWNGKEIRFTQKDVREIQLAKAAVRAGMETLILRYGVEREKIRKIFLAGGFGFKLNTEKTIAIGMLPEDFRGRIEVVGNSSLSGTMRYLRDPQGEQEIERIRSVSNEISLSMDDDFNELYMNSMMFEE